ncbi:telomere repeats-binding bouquet formation protein 1-like isoform X2 [Oscarella lobularis]|uniref:telomere repeats-binding bouquet formation protein 1-like isoform X2 n=1 Tax=Oscarella lobularis TaxID=121494 RepID=UPI003313E6C5
MSSTQETNEIKTNFSLLLDCLKFQTDSDDAQRQALTAIATMCSQSDAAKTIFRTCGGLKLVYGLMMRKRTGYRREVIFALACAAENCKANQSSLCRPELFEYVGNLIGNQDVEEECQTVALFLIGTLATNNANGQTMVREMKILSFAIELVKSIAPIIAEGSQRPNVECSVQMWETLMTVLRASVSNPVNAENQNHAAHVFPAILLVIKKTNQSLVIRTTTAVISACTMENSVNKDRLRLVDGIPVIVATLRNQSQNDEDSSVLALLTALCSLVSENEANQKCLARCGAMPLLVSLLEQGSHRDDYCLPVVLTIGSCLDLNDDCKREFIEARGLQEIVKVMASSQCEQVKKACTFVLQQSYKDTSKTISPPPPLPPPPSLSTDESQFFSAESQSSESFYSFHPTPSRQLPPPQLWKIPPPPGLSAFATPMRSTHHHYPWPPRVSSLAPLQFYTPQPGYASLSFLTPSRSAGYPSRGSFSVCPACTGGGDGVVLNSRTFAAVVRSSTLSCPHHVRMLVEHQSMARRLRREREGGAADETPQKEESAKKKKKSVYDLSPESENTTEKFKRPFRKGEKSYGKKRIPFRSASNERRSTEVRSVEKARLAPSYEGFGRWSGASSTPAGAVQRRRSLLPSSRRQRPRASVGRDTEEFRL